MTASPYRAEPHGAAEPDPIPALEEDASHAQAFDEHLWVDQSRERERQGGRAVLGWVLAVLAAAWLAYTAWSAGRVLASEPLSSPALAQWVAIAAGPLALLGLTWLMFGRTRRKEAERFTRSVIEMRTEARALQDVLSALSSHIDHNHQALGRMAGELMGLGDAAATRLGDVTRQLDSGSRTLAEHGAALDRAAEAARTDIGVLLADLPEAEQRARTMAEALREAGRSAAEQAAGFERQVTAIEENARQTDSTLHESAQRLVTHLTHIESAGAAATARLDEAGAATRAEVDRLLADAAEALDQVRAGIETQASAVTALIDKAGTSMNHAGLAASAALAERVGAAQDALDSIAAGVSNLDHGLAEIDQRFLALAEGGDERSARLAAGLGQLRADIQALGADTGAQDQAMLAMADRTEALRNGVASLSRAIAEELGGALASAEDSATRLLATSSEAHPTILAARDASIEAAERIGDSGRAIADQKQQLAELLSTIEGGSGEAARHMAELSAAIASANSDAVRLSAETGPALVEALLQVREAASRASERAREAIAEIIPQSAAQLSDAARAALERAIGDAVEERLAEVDQLTGRAVASARAASEQLTAQMLSIGQSAAALEAHVEQSREAARRDDGEAFARRVSLLIDSMHSASIDVQKILSDEVDERAWANYLKGDRSVFTRRAVRLIGGTEGRALQAHYESDPEFQDSVNRYVADFEAMLRRMLAERDGGMLAVTVMSSDMGKLYAALATAIDRRR